MIKEQVFSIIELVHYFLTNLGKLDKWQIIKLVYLADKYHLLQYGRTITNDRYYAMQYGPVASTLKDILEFDKLSMYPDEYKFATSRIKRVGENGFKSIAAYKQATSVYLSSSDIEAADYIIEYFGKMSGRALVKYTHKFPEWKKHEHKFKTRESRREDIPTIEMFSTIDDKFRAPDEHIESTKGIFLKRA